MNSGRKIRVWQATRGILALSGALTVLSASAQAEVGQTVSITKGVSATLDTVKVMSDGTVKVEFTLANRGSNNAYLPELKLDARSLCDFSLLDLANNKRYFPLSSPEGCLASRYGNSSLSAGEEQRIWIRFPKLPPEVKSVSLDVGPATFDDITMTP